MRMGIALLFLGLGAGCIGSRTNVRVQAAADLGCLQEHTEIVDAEVGVFLIRGCGKEASYQCPEMGPTCRRLFVHALPKTEAGEGLAKARSGAP